MDDWNQLREMLGQPVYATGGKAGSGLAPNLPWKDAINVFPKNPKVKAGARARDLPVSFTGKAPVAEVAHEYENTDWSKMRSKDAWAPLKGKRVQVKIVICDTGSQYDLDDIKTDDYQAFRVYGEEGDAPGGLPMHVYVKRGTRQERLMQDAKTYRSGTPDQIYLVKGVARENRTLTFEQIERVG